ncbi:MAG TPA: hypothetical protein VKV74_06935 [Bryobacteraceae bacterium]|nr:hypothetical protein [Bryobacteraceae bacterium]
MTGLFTRNDSPRIRGFGAFIEDAAGFGVNLPLGFFDYKRIGGINHSHIFSLGH